MKKITLIFLLSGLFFSCGKKEEIDLLVLNAKVYTVDGDFSVAEGFAVNDGKFIATGNGAALQEKFNAKEIIDAKGKTVLPGLIDAHAHFYGFGLQLQTVDLTQTRSFKEVVQRIVEFQKEKKSDFITGRGWDQNDWETKGFPVKDTLDLLFPETPVAITRIDGHAMLVNQAALDLAGITAETPAAGGEILLKDGEPTGILIDNPMALVEKIIPEPTLQEKANVLLDAQKIAFQNGLTTINDAGINKSTIQLIDSLQQANTLDIRIYAMISNTAENLDYFLKREPLKTDKLNVRSIKFYSDGALGSRGAALKEPYTDKAGHFGALLSPIADFKEVAARVAASEYQLNTHAIGDSANALVLRVYDSLIGGEEDRRWKVEHAQIVDEQDFHYFSKILFLPFSRRMQLVICIGRNNVWGKRGKRKVLMPIINYWKRQESLHWALISLLKK